MSDAQAWYICRIGFVETVRAVTLSAGTRAADAFRREWPAFGVIELDESLAEHAAELTILHGLRSLDAIHLAAGLVLPSEDLVFAAWDQSLHSAADAEGLQVLPRLL